MHVCEYETFDLGVTLKGTHFIDLTERIDGMIARAGVREGTVHVISRHTTTAVTINEMEDRLVDDARMFFHELAPPGKFYLHNDLDRRHGPPDWPGGDEAWRAQEPENCHSHLLSMLIGNSESIPVSGGKTTLGTWQSCMFVELDGPRERTVGIQVVGERKIDPRVYSITILCYIHRDLDASSASSCERKSKTRRQRVHHSPTFASGAGRCNARVTSPHSTHRSLIAMCLAKSTSGSNASTVVMCMNKRTPER